MLSAACLDLSLPLPDPRAPSLPHVSISSSTQGPAKGSGVIAVCLFGLYGSATGHWGMLATDAGERRLCCIATGVLHGRICDRWAQT